MIIPNDIPTPSAPNRPSTHAKDETGRFTLLGHDLRAAISDVLGGLRLIQTQGMDEATTLQFERVRAAGEGLARLLEEGMSFMPDEAALGPVALHMAKLLHDLEMRWAGRAREKGLSLQISLAANAPRHILVDRVALDRALSNVLSNAIKCTDLGEVRLDVSLSSPGILNFCVCDQGHGFSKAALDRLWQAHAKPAGSATAGQGLGLHICKQMAERLGATVSVRNQKRGARVDLAVPIHELPEGPQTTLPDLRGQRALIAEDSETNQAILAQMLAEMGAQVAIASDGFEALDLIARATQTHRPFDLALVDIEMPRLSGIDVIHTLRTGPHPALPIIAVTAYVLRSNREAIYAAGAHSILSKPLENIYGAGGAILRAQAEQAAKCSTDERPEIDQTRFNHVVAQAGSGAPELLRRMQADLSGCERGLVAALAAQDLHQIRTHTHVLLAVAGAVGAARLADLARALNAQAHLAEAPDFGDLGRTTLTKIDQLIQHIVTISASREEIK